MRQIKFRAWSKTNKKLLTNPLVDDGALTKPIDLNAMFVNETEDGLIFLQYTGLKDKNGVEIYEGDIVFIDNPCGQCPNEDYDNGDREKQFWNGCCYKWNTNWQIKVGGYWARNEYTRLSHNGKYRGYGVYAERLDTDSGWIVYGEDVLKNCEVIGNIYENPELISE